MRSSKVIQINITYHIQMKDENEKRKGKQEERKGEKRSTLLKCKNKHART